MLDGKMEFPELEFERIQLKFSQPGRQFPNLKHKKNNASLDALFFIFFVLLLPLSFSFFRFIFFSVYVFSYFSSFHQEVDISIR